MHTVWSKILSAFGKRGVIAALHGTHVSTGHQLWSARVTWNPKREKIEGALNISGRYVIVATGGYIGDAPVYQGHLALIDRSSGRVAHVWNALCSNRHQLLHPPTSCPASDAASPPIPSIRSPSEHIV